jgi:glycosyltransferase involved in cell wall biosynthesis
MQIGVDATCWQNRRGYGRHARGLLSALVQADTSNHYTFCLDSTEQTESLPSNADIKVVPVTIPTARAAAFDGRRSVRDVWRMSRALSASVFDLVLFPTIYSYVPVWSRAKKIVMIHDVIAESFPQSTQPSRAGQLLWNAKTAAGRMQANAIVTVSEYSRRAIVARFHLPAARVAVVGEAPDPIFRVLDNPQLPARLCELGLDTGRFVVYVGGFAPHKNLGTLLDAFAVIANRAEIQDVKLVLVGEYANEVFFGEFPEIEKRVQRCGLHERVIFTGFLPDEELVALLNRATVFVLPSLMEGFGLPAVEAAACGCPVIVTDASPLPSLLGRGALYFNPSKPDGLTEALIAVLTNPDLQARLRKQGRSAAARLTWEAAALQLEQIILQLGQA